ncbi:DUF2750 domain-containing protein [Neobacillus sp. WH10]|uniref:DUF2750 domain-containing protein n=1 Tax=Neobacillus sp. WH10 TaxID=3047873 RepID=UPI0024C134C9|nr:DUF2750 domain-containing protein [Neobacillus sp. WH10]WHY78647.1 DUF2750 domain-containing protein [Neobacillus sp. WH10]
MYLKKDYQIKTIDTKELVSATFFAPFEKNVEPYIRVATGDFEELVSESGYESAIFAILNSIAHEVMHYQQWIEEREFDEDEAETNSPKIVEDYYYGDSFFEELEKNQKVWTIENEQGVPTATNMEGQCFLPFWSSKLGAEKIIASVRVYQEYKPIEILLDDFLNWLTELEDDGLMIGINWRGKQLIGHEMEPSEIIDQIKTCSKAL